MTLERYTIFEDGRGGNNPARVDWSPDRVAKMIQFWNTGESASEVARKIGGGATRCSVIGKLHRLQKNKDKRLKRFVANQSEKPSLRVIINHEKIEDEEDFELLNIIHNSQPGDVWTWDDIADWFGKSVEEVKARYAALHDEYWLYEAA